MKCLLFAITMLAGAAAQAQLLPVPGGKNPDWVLLKTEKRPDDSPLIPPPSATDPMPNAAGKSIASSGNHHYYWDADHQLSYDWVSQGTTIAPFKLVSVREQRTDLVHIYRRAN